MRHLHLIPSVPQSTARLTPSEEAVVELAYLPNAEIAKLRHTSSATVKAQMRSVLVKLGAENRTQAALLWRERSAA